MTSDFTHLLIITVPQLLIVFPTPPLRLSSQRHFLFTPHTSPFCNQTHSFCSLHQLPWKRGSMELTVACFIDGPFTVIESWSYTAVTWALWPTISMLAQLPTHTSPICLYWSTYPRLCLFKCPSKYLVNTVVVSDSTTLPNSTFQIVITLCVKPFIHQIPFKMLSLTLNISPYVFVLLWEKYFGLSTLPMPLNILYITPQPPWLQGKQAQPI